jgi:hypothetical protein
MGDEKNCENRAVVVHVGLCGGVGAGIAGGDCGEAGGDVAEWGI